MKFNDLRVSHKLWSVILGLLLLMFAVALWTQVRTRQVTDEAERQVQHYEDSITNAVTWRGLAELAVSMSMASLVTTDEALQQDFDTRVAALTARISPVQERITKSAVTPADKEALAHVASTRAKVRGVGDKVAELKASGYPAVRQEFHDKEFRPRVVQYLDALDKYVALQEKQRDEARQAALQARGNVQLVAFVSAALLFGLSVVLVRLLVRSITHPLARAVAVAQAITAGDLTQQIGDEQRKDEFGVLTRVLSEMVGKLRGLVSEVRGGVEAVSTASTEIANGNHDLSVRTEQTASNLQQTASSMEELTGTVNQSAETARQANQLAATAAQVASRGGEVVGQVVNSMQHITDPGAQRRGRGGPRGGAGARLRGGGLRGAQPGPALGRGCQGDQGAHRRVGGDGRIRLQTGGAGRADHGRNRHQREARDRPDRRNHRLVDGAARRHRAGERRRGPAGPDDAAERRAGGRIGRRSGGPA